MRSVGGSTGRGPLAGIRVVEFAGIGPGPHCAMLLHDLAQRYVGPGTSFPPMPDPPEGFVIRITPGKVRGMGPWGTQFD